jgi:hypothetical protein
MISLFVREGSRHAPFRLDLGIESRMSCCRYTFIQSLLILLTFLNAVYVGVDDETSR